MIKETQGTDKVSLELLLVKYRVIAIVFLDEYQSLTLFPANIISKSESDNLSLHHPRYEEKLVLQWRNDISCCR